MRSQFPEFFGLSEDDAKALWTEGTIALDANVLLNVYRYAKDVRETLLGVLATLKDRLWVPYQFALEYHRNRFDVIASQASAYAEVRTRVVKMRDELRGDRAPLATPKSIASLDCLMHELRTESEDLLGLLTGADAHRDRLVDLLEGRVGKRPSDDEQADLLEKCRARFKLNAVPGKRDEKKGEPGMYGDCVGWLQLLDEMEGKGKPCILVTDDRKDDWWLSAGGRTIGPRTELVREYQVRCGRRFHMYAPSQFLRWASEAGVSVDSVAISELESLEQRNADTRGDADLEPKKSRELETLDQKRSMLKGG